MTFLEFVIKTDYVLGPWKTFCYPWRFSCVLESSWTVVNCSLLNYWLAYTEHSKIKTKAM